MQNFKTLEKYCEAIGISNPIHTNFDIRSFEENMVTVKEKMYPFRHEFYAVALKISGSGVAISGHNKDFPKEKSIFFNSPFQILSWDIKPDWKGYYIMFTQDFIAKSKHLQDILYHFPFLKIDKAIPFEINEVEAKSVTTIYESIFEHYNSKNTDKFIFIESYVLLLLNYVKRQFRETILDKDEKKEIRKTDLRLLSRFQTLIENSFQSETKLETFENVHSTSYYAEKLHIHPNHLNAVVKTITNKTAKQLIQNHILRLSKSFLIHTNESVKEIAYALHFDSPNNFSSFFKKKTKKSPNSYRKEINL